MRLASVAIITIVASTPSLACDSTTARWPNSRTEPLRAWIQPPGRTGPTTRDHDAVRDAFIQWNAVQLPVRFAFTPDSAAADVHVRWIPRFDRPISGNTNCSITFNGWILRAEVVLATSHSDGRRLDDDEMRVLALHEIGHALGLGHQPDGVMAATTRVRELTAQDRAAARRLYDDEPVKRRARP